jgi:galactosyl transferase GMA12/MNN10 family
MKHVTQRWSTSRVTSKHSRSGSVYQVVQVAGDDDDDENGLRRERTRSRSLSFHLTVNRFRWTRARYLLYSMVLMVVVLILVTCVYIGQRILSFHVQHREWVTAPITHIERTCPRPLYETMMDASTKATNTEVEKPKICIATLTDERNKSFLNRILGWRNFDGVMEMTWDNKFQYAKQHGYHLFDESFVVDNSRPPSWFKILAVRRLLLQEECDWVFWMDVDICVMNSTIRLEDFLPPSTAPHDLLLSIDTRGSRTSSSNGTRDNTVGPPPGVGYNAGAWIIRNTPWSLNFLSTWWELSSFVMPIGQSISGDNDAFKHLLRIIPEFSQHCLVPPRCTFNSFAKFIEPDQLAMATAAITEQSYYMDEAYYHKGDFVAHVAGISNKMDTIKLLLELAQ